MNVTSTVVCTPRRSDSISARRHAGSGVRGPDNVAGRTRAILVDHTEHAVEKQVVQLLDAEQAGARANAVAAEQNKLNESDQIHQTVPAHRQRAERKGDRVELGVEKHRRRRVG